MKQNGFGIASLVLGIFGIVLSCIAIGIVPSIIGLILAIIGLTRKDSKHGTSIAGLICSIVGIALFILFSFFVNIFSENSSTVSSDIQQEYISETEKVETNEINSNAEDLASKMEINEYSMENTIGDTYYILVVKNNSDKTVELNVNAIAKDADGKTIGATSSSENAVGSGREVCLLNYFDSVENASGFEYTLSVKEDKYYKDAVQNLDIEQSETDEKVILTITNKDDKPAQFVEAKAMFFKSGELIYYGSTYITDDDSEIKSGATISGELNCYDNYDDVKVYVSGRR